ncbi:MAG: hypothetical protein P8N02_07025 [Actinomycetota bacterium]|nr:hypothetical protein [Actinomycetota bacterium]
MSFDDRVRRHLHEAGSSLPVTGGRLGDVHRRAQRRARRQQVAVGALGATTVVAVVGLSVVMLSSGPGNDVDLVASGAGVSVEVTPAPSIQTLGSTIPSVTDAPSESAPVSNAARAESTTPAEGQTPPTSAEDDATESGQAVQAATSTTEAGVPAHWQQVDPPIESVYFDYTPAAGALVARTANEWYIDLGSGWEALPPPPSELVSVAMTVAAEGGLHLVGNLDDGPCSPQQMIGAYDGGSWITTAIGVAQPPGVQSTLLDAELRVTSTVTAVSRVEELRLDPLCLIRSIGMEAAEVRVVDDGFELVDVDGNVELLAAEDVELHEAVVSLLDGPQRRRSLVWVDDSGEWQEAAEPAWPVEDETAFARANPIGVAGSDVVAVTEGGTRAVVLPASPGLDPGNLDLGDLDLGGAATDGYLVRDGLVVGWSRSGSWVQWDGSAVTKFEAPLAVAEDGLVLDAVPGPDGWVVLHVDGVETWIHSPASDVALVSVSGKDIAWGRLGLVADQVRLVADSPVGPAVFALSHD